jgi:hypothetical protein
LTGATLAQLPDILKTDEINTIKLNTVSEIKE